MGLANFGSYDENKLKKNYEEAIKNEEFRVFAEDINLSNDEKMKYTSKLKESFLESKNCKDCKGIPFCKNKVSGFCYTPFIQGEHIRFDEVACRYEETVLKEERLSCDYYEMPYELKRARMKDIDISDAKRVNAIKWLKSFYDTYLDNPRQKGLYLTGSFGSGKTFLVCAMLNELARKDVDITVVYYPELLRSLKDAFATGEFASRINRLKKVSILFLDDIGAEAVTPWSRDEVLGTILQYRMDAGLPTFFTSNLNIEELEEHLASTKDSVDRVKARRIVERIKQLSTTVELVSKNRRN